MIFAFHTRIHLNASYWIFNNFVSMGAVFMTAFFMLSGFSLFVNHAETCLYQKKNIKTFWIKRIIGIIPMYYICGLIYALSPFDPDPVWQKILIAPVELLGIQSDFDGLFGHSHNGGTWFISCIIICYIAYPFLQEFIKMTSVRVRKICFIICICILLYAPLVQHVFETGSIYSNPFFRCLEFFIGMLLAAYKQDVSKKSKEVLYNWVTVIIATVIMFIGVSVGIRFGVGAGNYMLYSWICLPCFCLILFGLSGIKFKQRENRLLKMICSASYVIFLSQLYSNFICKKIIAFNGIRNNGIILLLGWGVGIGITIGLRIIEKPLTHFLKKRLLK